MPALGTKRTLLHGRTVYLPAEEVELAELITKGLELNEKMEALKEELAPIKARVGELAEKARGDRKSVLLEAVDGAGAAQVKFRNSVTVNEARAAELETEIGDQVASAIFAKQTVYTLRGGYSAFMRQPQAPELETLKARVGACVEVKEQRPTVTFLSKTRIVTPSGDGDSDDE